MSATFGLKKKNTEGEREGQWSEALFLFILKDQEKESLYRREWERESERGEVW